MSFISTSHSSSLSLCVEVSLFTKLCRLQVTQYSQTGKLKRVNSPEGRNGEDLIEAVPPNPAPPNLSVREMECQCLEGVNGPEHPQVGPHHPLSPSAQESHLISAWSPSYPRAMLEEFWSGIQLCLCLPMVSIDLDPELPEDFPS